jgi:hypothetical protein
LVGNKAHPYTTYQYFKRLEHHFLKTLLAS